MTKGAQEGGGGSEIDEVLVGVVVAIFGSLGLDQLVGGLGGLGLRLGFLVGVRHGERLGEVRMSCFDFFTLRHDGISSALGDDLVKSVVLVIDFIEDLAVPSWLDLLELMESVLGLLDFDVVALVVQDLLDVREGSARDVDEVVVHDVKVVSLEDHSLWRLVRGQEHDACAQALLARLGSSLR